MFNIALISRSLKTNLTLNIHKQSLVSFSMDIIFICVIHALSLPCSSLVLYSTAR